MQLAQIQAAQAWGRSRGRGDHVKTVGGAPYTFNYTVDVTHDAGTDSAWEVVGVITISNPNDWQDIMLTGLSDVADGGNCTVDPTLPIVPKGGSVDVNYTCTWTTKPASYSGTNTATATWDKDAASTPNGSASGSKDFTFTPTTIVDGSVTVSDPAAPNPPLPATVSYTDLSPKTFTYAKTFTDPAGTCTSHTNTATVETNTSKTKTSDSVTVTDCQGADLTVTKTATPSFTRTYTWGVDKKVDDANVKRWNQKGVTPSAARGLSPSNRFLASLRMTHWKRAAHQVR